MSHLIRCQDLENNELYSKDNEKQLKTRQLLGHIEPQNSSLYPAFDWMERTDLMEEAIRRSERGNL